MKSPLTLVVLKARSDGIDPTALIAGLDPAIPTIRHGYASISGMAGSSPAMTIP
jgi:hypothetical protein